MRCCLGDGGTLSVCFKCRGRSKVNPGPSKPGGRGAQNLESDARLVRSGPGDSVPRDSACLTPHFSELQSPHLQMRAPRRFQWVLWGYMGRGLAGGKLGSDNGPCRPTALLRPRTHAVAHGGRQLLFAKEWLSPSSPTF